MPFKTKKSPFWQYDFQIGGSRFRGSTDTTDFEAAKAIEAEIRVTAKAEQQGTKITQGIYTLSEAIGTYFTDICASQPSARTSMSHGKAILKVFTNPKPLNELTDADLLHYVARRRTSVSNATANRELQFMARCVKHMAHYHKAQISQLKWRRPQTKEPTERIRELTFDEQANLFAKLRYDLHPFVTFALMTGARRATICGLRWSAVDLTNNRIKFALKGGLTMFFPINAELRAFLTDLPRANSPESASYVFTYVNEQTLERLPINSKGGGVHGDFHKAVIEAEIEDFRFHDLRHTFATRMLRKEKNIKLVSKLLGHTSVETTMRYAHVLEDDLIQALSDFSALGNAHPQTNPQTDF